MSSVYFLIGPPASGKSTWRNAFLANNSTVVISSDDIIDDFAEKNNMTYSEAFKKIDFKSIDQKIIKDFQDALQRRDDIIIDRTNMNKKSRHNFMKFVPNNYKKIAVVFKVERDELQRRLDMRAKMTGKYIPTAVVDNMIASYVPPSVEEGFDKVFFQEFTFQ